LSGISVNFESRDLTAGDGVPQKPGGRKRRAVLGTLLAGIIAFLLIAIILAIISAMGERRLAQLRSEAMTAIPARPPVLVRPSLGLQVPEPLPVRPTILRTADSDDLHPVAPLDPFNPAAGADLHEPPAVAAPPPSVAALQPEELYPPARQNFGIPSSRISDAFLAKPDTRLNLAQSQQPSATQDLMQIRGQSRLLPEAARELADQRRPMQTLAERRAQAILARTSPSDHATQ
jgi:hypothetical protein